MPLSESLSLLANTKRNTGFAMEVLLILGGIGFVGYIIYNVARSEIAKQKREDYRARVLSAIESNDFAFLEKLGPHFQHGFDTQQLYSQRRCAVMLRCGGELLDDLEPARR